MDANLNEQYLAGTILLEGAVIYGLDGLIAAEDIADERCRAIFVAATELRDEGEVIDPGAIQRRAKRNGVDLPTQYLADLMDILPTSAYYTEYAKRVAEDARTRRIKTMVAKIQMDDTATPDELLGELQAQVAELSQGHQQSGDAFLSLFKPLTAFAEEEASWLIQDWVPEGQICVIAADGGVGKTTLWVHIVAAYSSGRRCILDPPEVTREPMKIAFLTTEDSVRKKLLKKLRRAGANMANIYTMDMAADRNGALRNLKFGSPEMETFIRHVRPALCVFDPLQGFIPATINMGSRNAMRDCMAPLIALGEEVGMTSLVICHTNKRKGAYGRDRIADSADIWDIARSVIMVGYTDEQDTRYLSNEKNNYTQLRKTILFTIDEDGQVSKVGNTWKRDREYMLEAVTAKSAPKRADCKEYILHELQEADGRYISSDELYNRALSYGYTYATIKRAREDLAREGRIENFITGAKGRKGRMCFVRIKQTEELAGDEVIAVESNLFEGMSETGR